MSNYTLVEFDAETVVPAGSNEVVSDVLTLTDSGEVLDFDAAESLDRLAGIEHPMVTVLKKMMATKCLRASVAQWARDYLVLCLIDDGKMSRQEVIFTKGRGESRDTRLIPQEPRVATAEAVVAEYAPPLVFLPR